MDCFAVVHSLPGYSVQISPSFFFLNFHDFDSDLFHAVGIYLHSAKQLTVMVGFDQENVLQTIVLTSLILCVLK